MTERPTFTPHEGFDKDFKGNITRKAFIEFVRNAHDHMMELERYIKRYDDTLDDNLIKWNISMEDLTVNVNQAMIELDELYEELLNEGELETNIAERLEQLEEEYAPLLNDLKKENESLTTQLAQNDDYLNQLQNIILNGEISPYFIENLATFSWVGSGTPENLAPYEGGNYYLEISGNAGDDFVTVKGGHDIADAGIDTKWAAVIKDDDGNWESYHVSGTNGTDRVYIFPNLKKSISNGEIANLHDVALGQHYTKRGTQALAQHVYRTPPKYANRLKYIEKFYNRGNGHNEHPWNRIGQNYIIFPDYSNLADTQSGYFYGNRRTGINVTTYAEGNTGGIEWEVNLGNHKGFLETFVRGSTEGESVTVEYYLDNELQETVYITDRKVMRLLFDFDVENKTGKIKFTIENSTKLQTFKVYDTTWWVTEKEHPNKIIPPHAKVVTYMDSWGTFHDYEFSRHLSKLISQDSGTTVDVIDHSQGGTTSIRGLAWFEDYVIKERPTHVVISYFTNDSNSIDNSLEYNYVAPDGQTYSMKLSSQEEYREKIFDMIELAISHGIQPIVIQPSSTGSFSQTHGFSNLDNVLMQGEKI